MICIESSHTRGLGHLYRSLTLAGELRRRGFQLHFLVNDHPIAMKLIRENGHKVDPIALESDSPWDDTWLSAHPIAKVWVNDRLDTGARHAQRVKARGLHLVTFDDRGPGAAFADLHIAALAFEDAGCLQGRRVLSGTKHLILEPELGSYRRIRDASNAWLVTMGGSDTWGVTPRVMELLLSLRQRASVVLGPSFNHVAEVDAILERAPADMFRIHRGGVSSLAEEMAQHDLAVTGGGMTPFQANAMGLPCIVIANEYFEVPVGQALERLGGSVFAGFHQELDFSLFSRKLPIQKMSAAGMSAMDLQGLNRVANAFATLVERDG